MKNWLSIGQFSKRVGLSNRTLRIYEEMGLIRSHARGENGYRYYAENQLDLACRIKRFKDLGFSLDEIRELLQVDVAMNPQAMMAFLQRRLRVITGDQKNLAHQKEQIRSILSSLENANGGLNPVERRFIMSHFRKISIVVTGVKDLEQTAEHIQEHLRNADQGAEVIIWSESVQLPAEKPYILVIPETLLTSNKVKTIAPDVVVIKNLSAFNSDIELGYLNLYSSPGSHMTTIFNADDRISVELAANSEIRKGRIFYFSKNSGLQDQIEKIGGVISDGDEVKIFGFNMQKGLTSIKLARPLAFDEETALIASLAAVMDVGLTDYSYRDSRKAASHER